MTSIAPRDAPLTQFIAPALNRPQLWRTVAGLVLASVLYILAIQIVIAGLAVILGPGATVQVLKDMAQGATKGGLVALLFSYLPLTAAVALVMSLLLKRGFLTVFGPIRPAIRCFVWVAGPLLVLCALLVPLSVNAVNVVRHLTLGQQAPWLPLALLGLLVQTGTEEIIFRGYLLQQLAVRFRSRLVWMVLPSVLFGALHYSPAQYGATAWFVVIWAMLFGLAAADLTARTGNLGAAMGLHFANNASGLLMVGLARHMDGMALYSTVLDMTDAAAQLPYLAIDTVTLLVGYLAARLILRV